MISRRNLILQLGFQVPAMMMLPSAPMAQRPFKSFQLVLSGISDATPPKSLLAILQPFVSMNVPISCIVAPQTSPSGIRPHSALAATFRHLMGKDPARIEVIQKVPSLGDRPYYFQSRLMTKARRALEDAVVVAQSDTQLARSLLTVVNTDVSMDYGLGGVRAAGFRTVLTLPEFGTKPVDSHWDKGVLHIFGGMRFGLSDPFDEIENALRKSVRDDRRSLLCLSVDELAYSNTQQAIAHMTKIANLLSELTTLGQIVPSTPTDYHRRVARDSDTVIGLRLYVLGKPDDPKAAPALDLALWLRAHKIAFTVEGKHALDWAEFSSDTCRIKGATNLDDEGVCEQRSNTQSKQTDMFLSPPKVVIGVMPTRDRIAGVDNQARLHPPKFAFIDAQKTPAWAVPELRQLADTILDLYPHNYTTDGQRQKTTNIISDLKDRAGFLITDVSAFANKIQPRDSLRRVYDQTQNVMQREHLAIAEITHLDHDLIRADASLAWHYLKKFKNPKTGLIPSTVHIGGEVASMHNYVTMWDIGSQLFGMISAVKLDLITMRELNQWATHIIKGLPSVSVQGMRLPSAIVHVMGTVAPNQAFNSCDVGRLLSAFHNLRGFSPALKELIDQKVAGWTLQQTILDGRMHDFTTRSSHDRTLSHCSHYAAKGFAAFGIIATSPYALQDGYVDADALMDLLFWAAEIGIIGAEPLLMEGIEQGFTSQSQFLADMLFAAQLEDNRKTGTMRCVSEGPLDRAPWFAYQGYDIGDFDDPWKAQVISDDKKFENPDFLRSIEGVSVKAAYLWAATHPHSYSYALVEYVRARARIRGVGFSPGIFLASGKSMPKYTDLNTNAIILEACAHILKE